MRKTVCRYQFEPEVPLEEIKATLLLALIEAGRLYGQAKVRRSIHYLFGEENHTCVISGDNEAARYVARRFTEFLSRCFGEDAFQVELVSQEDRTERPANGKSTPGGRVNGRCNGCEPKRGVEK